MKLVITYKHDEWQTIYTAYSTNDEPVIGPLPHADGTDGDEDGKRGAVPLVKVVLKVFHATLSAGLSAYCDQVHATVEGNDAVDQFLRDFGYERAEVEVVPS